MDLHQRIKQRRIELGMSQEELAFKLGYKSRSSINKIEMGDNDIPQSKILDFAKALDTTPSFLLGLDEYQTTNISSLQDDIMKKLDLKAICQLNDDNITKVNKYANNLLNLQQIEDEPVLMAAHHDNPTPEEQEKMLRDLNSLKRPTK